MVGLRLLCPNGRAGEVAAPEGHKFLQLKVGWMDVGLGGQGGRACAAHIIGVVRDISGHCYCWAWDTGKGKLIEFYDNIYNMQYQHIGRLSLEVQGIKI